MSGTRAGRAALPRGPVLGFSEGRKASAEMRRLRVQAGLSAAELAGLLGQKVMWVGQRERGSVRMTQAEAELVAAVFASGRAMPSLLEDGTP